MTVLAAPRRVRRVRVADWPAGRCWRHPKRPAFGDRSLCAECVELLERRERVSRLALRRGGAGG